MSKRQTQKSQNTQPSEQPLKLQQKSQKKKPQSKPPQPHSIQSQQKPYNQSWLQQKNPGLLPYPKLTNPEIYPNMMNYPLCSGIDQLRESGVQLSSHASSYRTVEAKSDKMYSCKGRDDQWWDGDVIDRKNQVDDDDHDFKELMQQFDALNISQILPKGTQLHIKPQQPPKKAPKSAQCQQFKLVKQLHKHQKQQSRNRLFSQLSQSETKSLILGSYIHKLLTDTTLGLQYLKDLPYRYPGSVRIPTEEKKSLLMFLQEIIQQVGLDSREFSATKYKWKIEDAVKQVIAFSRKIQTHFTARKRDIIYPLTQFYMATDYIHTQAKKIFFRNLQKIIKQHNQYLQKIQKQSKKKQTKSKPPKKAQIVQRSNSTTSQDCELFELASQKNKLTTQSEVNNYKNQEDEDIRSIGFNSENNWRYGYSSQFEGGRDSNRYVQKAYHPYNINMNKSKKQKQEEKQCRQGFGQISNSLQKWKERQKILSKQKLERENSNSKLKKNQQDKISVNNSQSVITLGLANNIKHTQQSPAKSSKNLKICKQFGYTQQSQPNKSPKFFNTINQLNFVYNPKSVIDTKNDRSAQKSYLVSNLDSDSQNQQQVKQEQRVNKNNVTNACKAALPQNKQSSGKINNTVNQSNANIVNISIEDSLAISMSINKSNYNNTSNNTNKKSINDKDSNTNINNEDKTNTKPSINNNSLSLSNLNIIHMNGNSINNSNSYNEYNQYFGGQSKPMIKSSQILVGKNNFDQQTGNKIEDKKSEESSSSQNQSDSSGDAEQTILQHNTQLLDITRFISKNIANINSNNSKQGQWQSDQDDNEDQSEQLQPIRRISVEKKQNKSQSPKNKVQFTDKPSESQIKVKTQQKIQILKKEQKKQSIKVKQQPNTNPRNLQPPIKQQVPRHITNPPKPIPNRNAQINSVKQTKIEKIQPNIVSLNQNTGKAVNTGGINSVSYQGYKKISSYLQNRLTPQLAVQFQQIMQTYYNSKPAFHVQPRRKLLDFVYQLTEQITTLSKTPNLPPIPPTTPSSLDSATKISLQVCRYMNGDKIAELRETCRVYYKDYFRVEERRALFADVGFVIRVVRGG